MSRLDKYLLSQLARSTIIATVVALVVLLALQVLRLAPLIINQDLDFGLIMRIVGGLALGFTTLVLPLAFTFAQLSVFGRMSSEKEFVAMQAMGHSPYRLMRTCVLFSLIITALSLWSALWLSPFGNRIFDTAVNEAYKRKVASVLRSGTFTEDFLGTVFFVENVNSTTNELDRVFMYDEDGIGPKSVISAKKGSWQVTQETGLGVLTLRNGIVLSEDATRDTVRRIKFDEYKVNADFSQREGTSKGSPPNLPFTQLLEKIATVKTNIAESGMNKKLSNSIRSLWAELARRFAVSFACVSLIPLCFGVSLSNKRTAKNRATLTGIVILFAYWTIYFAFLTWFLKWKIPHFSTNQIFAWIFLWIPNILSVILGYFIMRRRSKLAS